MLSRAVVLGNSATMWLFLASALFVLAGCESASEVAPRRGLSPRQLDEATSRPIQTLDALQITIYLPRLFEDNSLGLRAVARDVEPSEVRGREALEALIRGPNGDERAANFQYALERRTRVKTFRVEGGTAMIELDEGLERVHGRPFSELVYWAIVYTLTETPGVERVVLARGDAPVTELGAPPARVPAPAGRVDVPSWARPR